MNIKLDLEKSKIPILDEKLLKTLDHGALVRLTPQTSWERWVPQENGVVTKNNDGCMLNWMAVEPLQLPPEYKLERHSAFINPNLVKDNVGRLNDDTRLKVEFPWKQFSGHPYGAMFDTDEGILLLIDRTKFDKKFK